MSQNYQNSGLGPERLSTKRKHLNGKPKSLTSIGKNRSCVQETHQSQYEELEISPFIQWEKYQKINGILTGHCLLNKYAHTIGLNHSPLCDKCGKIETADHFLYQWPMSQSEENVLESTFSRAKTSGGISFLDHLNRTKGILNIVNYGWARQVHWRLKCKGFNPFELNWTNAVMYSKMCSETKWMKELLKFLRSKKWKVWYLNWWYACGL